MSGTRRSRATPSITNRPTCGGPKKAGLAVTWGRNVALLSRSQCGIRRANLCPIQLKCCPAPGLYNSCPESLIKKNFNFVVTNSFGQTTGTRGSSMLWR